jgi:cell shape-determining protein MreC
MEKRGVIEGIAKTASSDQNNALQSAIKCINVAKDELKSLKDELQTLKKSLDFSKNIMDKKFLDTK